MKGNQPPLFQAIRDTVESPSASSTSSSDERSRGRHERRTVAVFMPPGQSTDGWTGLHRVLHVERQGSRTGQETLPHHDAISRLCSDEAEVVAVGIRGHWSRENRLHGVKDVIQHEDDSRIRKGNGVETLSLLKNVAMNRCRELGVDSIKAAAIHFASHVKELCTYFRT